MRPTKMADRPSPSPAEAVAKAKSRMSASPGSQLREKMDEGKRGSQLASGIAPKGARSKLTGRSSMMARPGEPLKNVAEAAEALDGSSSAAGSEDGSKPGSQIQVQRKEIRRSTRMAASSASVSDSIDSLTLIQYISAFRKALVGALPTFLLKSTTSLRGTYSASMEQVTKIFFHLKDLDLKSKQITRGCCLIGVPTRFYASFLETCKLFRALVKMMQELQEYDLALSIESRSAQILEEAKALSSFLKSFEPAAAEAPQAGLLAQQYGAKIGSSVKIKDIFEHAKLIAKSLSRMVNDHSADIKISTKAALARQTLIFKFAALGKNFANRINGDDDQKRLLLDFASTIVLASGRLYSVELSLIQRTLVGDPSSALQASLMSVTQMVTQFCMSCSQVIQTLNHSRAARKQKETDIWEEIPFKNPSNLTDPTFNQLILVITDLSSMKNMGLIKTFFRTYGSLCTASYLFEKIKQRYVKIPSSLGPVVANEIQMGCLACLKEWLAISPRDFTPNLIRQIIDFDSEVTLTGESSILQPFLCTLTLTHQAKLVMDRIEPPLLPESESQSYLLSMSPSEIAVQLTILESEIFCSISSRECLDSNWSKPNAEINSPNIVALINQHSLIQDWVISSILRCASLRERTQRLTFFFQIAVALFKLNNFSSLAAIETGISLPALKRLKYTFAEVLPALSAEWKTLSSTISAVNNYAVLRPVLRTSQPPLVPPLGMFLTELIHIEDRHQLYTSRGLVNWKKLDLVGSVISQLQEYQTPYLGVRDNRFSAALFTTKLARLSSEQQFIVSSEREPRNAKLTDLIP